MAAMRLLVLAALGGVGAVELGKTTYNLNLIVERGEFERTLADAQALLEETKRKKMGVAVQLLLRSAADKITKSFEELEKRRADEAKAEAKASAAEAARPYEAPTTLTNASVGVKPLKAFKATAKKSNTIRRVTLAEWGDLEASGKLTDALKKPMILEGALGNRDALRESFHAARLMEDPAFSDVRIEYVTPAVARSKRTFEEQDASAPQEYEHTAISLERYFVNCFNLRAKPDFRKRGGGQTEHCEQDLAFGSVAGANASGILDGSPLKELAGAGLDYDRGRAAFLVDAATRGVAGAARALGGGTTRLVLGPAGSGEHLRNQRTPFLDGLVHGKRRWFAMSPAAFGKLRAVAEAAETLEPSSAFVFFESQLEELVEDLGLGGSKMRYAEGTQEPGDVLFMPPDTVFTSLTYADAVSVRGLAAGAHEAGYTTDSKLWMPAGGHIPENVAAAACYGTAEFLFDAAAAAAATPGDAHPAAAQIVGIADQILPQIYGTAEARDGLALGALADCAGYAAVAGSIKGSQCEVHAAACARVLGLDGAPWLADLLSGMFVKKRDW